MSDSRVRELVDQLGQVVDSPHVGWRQRIHTVGQIHAELNREVTSGATRRARTGRDRKDKGGRDRSED